MLTPFDPANYLESEEDILHYLEAAMEGNYLKHIARAQGDVARSKGGGEIVRKSGLGRQAHYGALSEDGNPTLETRLGVLDALGLPAPASPREIGSQDEFLAALVVPGGPVRAVPVQLGPVQGNEVVIRSGLQTGQRVVAAGVHVLSPGQKVTVYGESTPAGK